MSDDLPDEIMVWRSNPNLPHLGTWATTRYPAEAVAYVTAATITQLRADLDAANERADILRADREAAVRMWQASEQEREAAVARSREASQMLAIETHHASEAEADAAALRAQVDEAWNAAIEEAAQVADGRG